METPSSSEKIPPGSDAIRLPPTFLYDLQEGIFTTPASLRYPPLARPSVTFFWFLKDLESIRSAFLAFLELRHLVLRTRETPPRTHCCRSSRTPLKMPPVIISSQTAGENPSNPTPLGALFCVLIRPPEDLIVPPRRVVLRIADPLSGP